MTDQQLSAMKEVLRGEARSRASLWLTNTSAARDEQHLLNQRLTQYLLQHSQPGDGIALFAGRGAELNLEDSARNLYAAKRKVYFPRILTKVKEGAQMGFAEVVPGEGSFVDWGMEVQAWGIAEPNAESVSVYPGDEAGHIDWLVLPCLLGDDEAYRVGHGGGYYDRFLATLRASGSKCQTILPLLSWQYVSDPLPRESWDIPADYALYP